MRMPARLLIHSNCRRSLLAASNNHTRRCNSTAHTRPSGLPSASKTEQDADPIPTRPTWSVHALLSSYPRPQISDATLTKLHTLSALTPPVEGSEAASHVRNELEEMVRLVEAVKLVDTSSTEYSGQGAIPDGRIWEEGKGIELSSNTRAVEFEDAEVEHGRELLKHAALTKDGFYVVEANRRKK